MILYKFEPPPPPLLFENPPLMVKFFKSNVNHSCTHKKHLKEHPP